MLTQLRPCNRDINASLHVNANKRKCPRIFSLYAYGIQHKKHLAFIRVHLRSFAFSFSLILTALNPISADTIDPNLRSRLISAINQSKSFDDRFHAEVWLLDMSTRLKIRVKDSATRLKLLRSIHREASLAKLPPELVIALIDIESRFNNFAISRSGAQGLMQIMPFWLKEIGHAEDNLMDIDTNLRMGCTILKYYLDMEKGNIRRALARYNGSLGSWKYPDKVISTLNKNWYRS